MQFQNQIKAYQMAMGPMFNMSQYAFPSSQQMMKNQNLMQHQQNQQNQLNQMQMMQNKMMQQNAENSPAPQQNQSNVDNSTMSRSASNTSLSSMTGNDMSQQTSQNQMMNAVQQNFMQNYMQNQQNYMQNYMQMSGNSLQSQMQGSQSNLLSQMQQQQQQQNQQQQPQTPTQPPPTQSKNQSISNQKKQKQNQMQQNKRKPKKHSATSDVPESPLPTPQETPQTPVQSQVSMPTSDVSSISHYIALMPEEKHNLFYRIFGCNFKRGEGSPDAFTVYFANNIYKTIPNAISYANYFAQQFKNSDDMYNVFNNPKCPNVFMPAKNIKPQFQIMQCLPNMQKGSEFNLLPPTKRGDAFPYGLFLPRLPEQTLSIIVDDSVEVQPSSLGDNYMYYLIPQTSKNKITIKPQFISPTTPVSWFTLCYATKRAPIDVLHALLDKAGIKREFYDQVIAETPNCRGCALDPLTIIQNCQNGKATCPECGQPIVLTELIIKVKPCATPQNPDQLQTTPLPKMNMEMPIAPSLQQQQMMMPQIQQQAQPLPPEPENPEEDKLAMALGDAIAQCIRPKQESSGWIRANYSDLITPIEDCPKFYVSSLNELEKQLDDLYDDFF